MRVYRGRLTLNSGNPEGYNNARPLQDYGPPQWGGVGGDINPFLSDDEFRYHFGFASWMLMEVLEVLQFP